MLGFNAIGLDAVAMTGASASQGGSAVVTLTGATCTQTSVSAAGTVTITQGAQTLSLVGTGSTQTATCSAGAVTVAPAAKTVGLTGSSCTQAAQSPSAVISVRHPGAVDISRISSDRTVVFDGSGSRAVVFEGSGGRVVIFEGSGSRVRLDQMSAKVPVKVGEKWTVDRDPDEISYYAADITEELLDRNTTADQSMLVAVLFGVALLEGPELQVATIDGVQRTFVAVKLGGVDDPLPADWRWVARVSCLNGERFDKTTWFNKVDP